MTLPEIPKEENEQPVIKKCPDCGKPCKNLGVHKRYCKESKGKSAMKQEPILNAPISTPQTPADPLIISDVQPYIGNNVAWFEGPSGKYFEVPEYIGIVNNVPVVLVQFHDGALIPPALMPGFIGMFKEGASFGNKQDDDEPFPPFPEEVEEEKKTEIKAHLLDEKITSSVECKQAEKPKKSWWPFSHKKTVQPETPKPDTTELTGLLEGAINATG